MWQQPKDYELERASVRWELNMVDCVYDVEREQIVRQLENQH